MSFRVSGKNIDVGEALRERINDRIAEATGKYFDGGSSGHVVIAKEAFGFRTECVIHLDSGIMLEAEAFAVDAYASADQAAERIEKRLRRYKRRLKGHQARADNHVPDGGTVSAQSYVIATPEHESDDEAGDFTPVIIAETTTALRTFSVSEAVAELDLTGAAVVVFRHAGHGRVNFVHRRPDGHIGWIDPPALDAPASKAPTSGKADKFASSRAH
jgi:ribosomal subunit interface protein